MSSNEEPYYGIEQHPNIELRTPSTIVLGDIGSTVLDVVSLALKPNVWLASTGIKLAVTGGGYLINNPVSKVILGGIESVHNYIEGEDYITDRWNPMNRTHLIDNPLSIVLGPAKQGAG